MNYRQIDKKFKPRWGILDVKISKEREASFKKYLGNAVILNDYTNILGEAG